MDKKNKEKWIKTGLLEGLSETEQENFAVLLENTASGILEDPVTSINVGKFLFPITARIFRKLNKEINIKVMTLPATLIKNETKAALAEDFKYDFRPFNEFDETSHWHFSNIDAECEYVQILADTIITALINKYNDDKSVCFHIYKIVFDGSKNWTIRGVFEK